MKIHRCLGPAIALMLGACGSAAAQRGTPSTLPQGSAAVRLDPADFTTDITNPYWPMKPGTRWTFRERTMDGSESQAVITVTNQTRTLANGITGRVVRDTLTAGGSIVEDTIDWYAQDKAGNLWYLGEDTAEFAGGKVSSTGGSFEAGAGGAQPGIAVPAAPTPGLTYRQEYLKGEAEDNGEVLSVREQAQVPTGHYDDVLLTKDTSAIEGDALEYKLYAKGVGPVLVLTASGGDSREELVRVDTAPDGSGTGPLGAP